MNIEELKKIIEAALMTSPRPLGIPALAALFAKDPGQPEKDDIRRALEGLREDYAERGVELVEVASGFRFQAKQQYAWWLNRLFAERPPRYSRALLETLAIIAYRQPITRGEIENIRGVGVNANIIRTLQEREWIRTVGRREDVPGRPEMLVTTRQFLDYFNLRQLADLPSLPEVKDLENINPDLFAEPERPAAPAADGSTPSAGRYDDGIAPLPG